MASVRDIRKRIKSVKSTQKITKAMKMVAAARLRRAQEAAEQSNPYSMAINKLLIGLSQDEQVLQHPMIARRDGGKTLYVVLSSDRGLCGAFNSGLFKKLERHLEGKAGNYALMLVGRKAINYFSDRSHPVYQVVEHYWDEFDHEKAKAQVRQLSNLFLDTTFDRICIVYNEFESVMSQIPRIDTLLPLSTSFDDGHDDNPASKDTLFEPNKEEILEKVIPKAIEVRFYRPCLHSLASEFGARMAAMDSASRNAGDMIDTLTLTMNRLRQANITTELVEIISGAEAIG